MGGRGASYSSLGTRSKGYKSLTTLDAVNREMSSVESRYKSAIRNFEDETKNKDLARFNELYNGSRYDFRNEEVVGEVQRLRRKLSDDRKKLDNQYNNEMDALRSIQKELEPKKAKTFVNSFGEATTRDITSASDKRWQRRNKKAVLRNMGVR